MFLDAVIGFRLEYLYPAIMFLRSVLDSYKYQGLVRKRGREGSCGIFIFDTWLLVLLGFPCYYNNPHSSKHSLACFVLCITLLLFHILYTVTISSIPLSLSPPPSLSISDIFPLLHNASGIFRYHLLDNASWSMVILHG